MSRARRLTAGSHSVKAPCSQPGVSQCQRVLRQSSTTCRSPVNTSRGAVRGRSSTRVAALPHRGQQRAASKAGSVITSTRVCPSGVSVTAVTSSPRIPSRTVAAAQARRCGLRAGPAEPVPSIGGGSFCGFAFPGRTENPGEPPFVCKLQ